MKYIYILFVTLTFAIEISSSCPLACTCVKKDTEITCKNAALAHLPEGKFSKKAKTLDLSFNRIPILKNDVFANHLLYSLETIIISHNGLSSIEPESLIGLSSLIHLDLSYNDIADIQAAVFDNVGKLEILLLNNNSALSLPKVGFGLTELKELNLKGCGLRHIPARFFDNMPNIETLILSNNNLAGFDSNQISLLTSLKRLDLNLNKLSYLREVIHELPETLSLFNIANNRWACDCDIGVSYPLYEKGAYNKQLLKCSSPRSLANRNITDELLGELAAPCTATTSTVADLPLTTESTDSDVEELPANHTDRTLATASERRGNEMEEMRMAPDNDNTDVMLSADVGSGVVAWFDDNQWWVITGTTLLVLTICILAISHHVNQFRKRPSGLPTDYEMVIITT